MSTIFFSARELGNVARALAPGASDLDRQSFASYCKGLAIISADNARAYNVRYRDGQETGHSAQDIAKAAPNCIDVSEVSAVDTACLLDYNLDDEATPEAHQALVSILGRLLRKVGKPRGQRLKPPEQCGQAVSIFDL